MAKRFKPKPANSASKIFIVEDHPVFREGIRQIVSRESDLKVCGEAGNYEDALREILRLRPDLALVDISLPGRSGLDLIRKLRSLATKVKLLIVSMHDEALYADRVLRAGGDGYIMKQEDPEEVIHAIRDVLTGHIYVSEAVLESGASKPARSKPSRQERVLDKLTDTELEVLELIGRGKTLAQIGRQLSLDAKAVGAYRSRIQKKLNLKNGEAVTRYASSWVGSGT